jgi:hypothetical protein
MWITAIATVVIAIYAFMSYRLASKIKAKDDEHRQQTTDLYQAIVISNLIGERPMVSGSEKIKYFKAKYKGKTPIFD